LLLKIFQNYDKDGVIWCVNFVKAHEFLPQKLIDALHNNYAYGFTTEMLDELVPDFMKLKALCANGEEYVTFFEPPSIDNRIVNQYALLSVMSDPSKTLTQWLEVYS